MRKILHIDMDAFFASVEQVDNPELKGFPVAVGGNAERGVIAAASYEARKFGVYSAMSSSLAKKLCPELIFVKPNFERYKHYSKIIHKVFKRYTNKIEPLSLDEAYLDVTENKINQKSATFIANAIKNEIYNETGLYASAGVSYCKFFAKIASDQDKPNGLFVIEPKDAKDFIANMFVGKIHGVGKVTAEKMNKMGIFKGKDLKSYSEKDLVLHFGKSGSFLFNLLEGIDEREVVSNSLRKSIGAENTFSKDLVTMSEVNDEAEKLVDEVIRRSEKLKLHGKTITLKIKFSNFKQITRSQTLDEFVNAKDFKNHIELLVENIFPTKKSIRLVGVSLSNLEKDLNEPFSKQLDLFEI